ncbi:MAG: PIN domain-containing protein [Akkermansiaceae bacterium]|jgi:predicted nucleic acid-binding protein|nr:PIN domain-containing protein [Akkermansiaceae bacterium]MDP4720420.1 PIN domain-containing protein [Akkermansiaceae bacterium]MDP4779186.1 PIN domain-containing protein [Akkermansiaceae bacterium]MDP4898560.1 PIN domain-containing protein [Akkermansiaceae bacterium]
MERLIETSLWIDFVRKKSAMALKAFIEPWILDADACICEPVAFEVLRHATVKERSQIEEQFSTLPLLQTPATLWQDAASLGQKCRDKGVNVGSMDLVIAALAIHHAAEIVTFDADYARVAEVFGLSVMLLERP